MTQFQKNAKNEKKKQKQRNITQKLCFVQLITFEPIKINT